MHVDLSRPLPRRKIKKFFTPLCHRWLFFLRHQHREKTTSISQKTQALCELVESLFRFVVSLAIADYLYHPERHNKQKNQAVLQALTRKRDYPYHWHHCLETIWHIPEENSTFLAEIFCIEPEKILDPFYKILSFADANAKKEFSGVSASKYQHLLNHFYQLNRLTNFLTLHEVVAFQDYPWSQEREITVPTLSFSGNKEGVFYFQDLCSQWQGIPGELYLSNPSKTEFLPLYPLIIRNTHNNSLLLFQYFRQRRGKSVDYFDYQAMQAFTYRVENYPCLVEEFQTICRYLKRPLQKKLLCSVLREPSCQYTLYLPLERISDYQVVEKRLEEEIAASDHFLNNIYHFLDLLFVRSFTKRICELKIPHLLPSLGLSQTAAEFLQGIEKNGRLSFEVIQQVLEELIAHNSSETEKLLSYLWQQSLIQQAPHRQLVLLEFWARYNWEQAFAKMQEVPALNTEETLLALVKPLLEKGDYEKAVRVYKQHCNLDSAYFLNAEIGPKLIQAFLAIEPELGFALCRHSLNRWDEDWISQVTPSLLQTSVTKTIELFAEETREMEFNAASWDQFFKVYHIIQRQHPEQTVNFLESIQEPVTRLRLMGLYFIEQENVSKTREIVAECERLTNPEYLLSSMCFLAHMLKRSLSFDLGSLYSQILHSIKDKIQCLLEVMEFKQLQEELLYTTEQLNFAHFFKLKQKLGNVASAGALALLFPYLKQQKVEIESLSQILQKLSRHQEDANQPSELEGLSENYALFLEEKWQTNTTNQILAEAAAVFWSEDQQLSLFYLDKIVPDTLFEREDAIRQLVLTNPEVDLLELEALCLHKYEFEALQAFWLSNRIRSTVKGIPLLYSQLPSHLQIQLVHEGFPQLVSEDISLAGQFVQQIAHNAGYDFQSQAGILFLSLFHSSSEAGKAFLQILDPWELRPDTEMGQSLLKALKKLSSKKLQQLYEELILSSQASHKEGLCLLLLSAMVCRRPHQTFTKLINLRRHLTEEAIESMILHLIKELANLYPSLARELLEKFYGYQQSQTFSFEEESGKEFIAAINQTLAEEKKPEHIPEIFLSQWVVLPSLLGKFCQLLLHQTPTRAVRISKLLVGKPEIFLILGEKPFDLVIERTYLGPLSLASPTKQLSLSPAERQQLFASIKTTLAQLPVHKKDEVIPYLAHPYWKKRERKELLALLSQDNSNFSHLGRFTFIVLREAINFHRSRFAEGLKSLAEEIANDSSESLDFQKKLAVYGFRILLRLRPKLLEDLPSLYWDQGDRIASVMAHVFTDGQEQLHWLRKIISLEERMETIEELASDYLVSDTQVSEDFLEEGYHLLSSLGGAQLMATHVPSLLMLMAQQSPEKLIEAISELEEDCLAFAAEIILEFLTTPENFSLELYLTLEEWIASPTIQESLPYYDALYFYSQLALQLMEIHAWANAENMVVKSLQIARNCEENEKKYYLEDLIEPLAAKNPELALEVVQSYEHNGEEFQQLLSAWVQQDSDRAIQLACEHPNEETRHALLRQLACEVAYSDPEKTRELMQVIPDKESNYDPIWQALSLAALKKKRSSEKYIHKISSHNQVLQTYVEMAKFCQDNQAKFATCKYHHKIPKLLEQIQPSAHLFGVTFEWPDGERFKISHETLEHLALVAPEQALEVFQNYLKNDRFAHGESYLPYLFRGLQQSAPHKISKLLQENSNFDISYFHEELLIRAKKSPYEVISWLLQCQEPEPCREILDKISDHEKLLGCLNLLLSNRFSCTPMVYLEKIVLAIPYLYKLGEYPLLLATLKKIQCSYLSQGVNSLEQLLETFEQSYLRWESQQHN